MFVASARAQDDPHTSVFFSERQIDGHVGHADKGDAAVNEAVLAALGPCFLDFAGRSRLGGIGPEVDGRRLGEKRHGKSEEQNEM